MQNNDTEADIELQNLVINILKDMHPDTNEELISLIQSERNLSRKKILQCIFYLESQGKISFKTNKPLPIISMQNFVFSTAARWYWMIILIAITAIVFVFVAPENAYPLVYLRYLFGGLLVFFLPGYSLIKLLFPSKEIDNIERTALSIGLSLALVPIIGIALNYTPWGITFIPITLSLFAVTSIFATIAIVREFQTNPTSK